MIYCGYQGSGKSTYCKQNPNTTIDLDSSAFVKYDGWEHYYISNALSFSKMNKNVFVSAHKEVIKYLMDNKIDFAILAPKRNKDAWRARLQFRYYSKGKKLADLKAINDFEENYDKDMNYYEFLQNQGIKVFWIESEVKTNISTFIK